MVSLLVTPGYSNGASKGDSTLVGRTTPMTAERVSYRFAGLADLQALLALEASSFGVGPYRSHGFDARQFRYYLKNPRAIVILASDASGLIGSVIATAGTRSRAHVGRILNLAVVKLRRKAGIGRKLLAKAERWMKQQGCDRIYLEVAQGARAATEFFVGRGFVPVRRLPDYYGRNNHGLRMKRELN